MIYYITQAKISVNVYASFIWHTSTITFGSMWCMGERLEPARPNLLSFLDGIILRYLISEIHSSSRKSTSIGFEYFISYDISRTCAEQAFFHQCLYFAR